MTTQPTTQSLTARPSSPVVVFLACFLLAGVAALRVVAAITDFYALPHVTRYYSDAHGDAAAGQVAGVGLVLLAVLSLVVGCVYLLLAVLDARGMNPARVLTWVMAGLSSLVSTITLLVGVYDAVPWYHRLSTGFTAVSLAFVVIAIVLLALPPAHRYYRAARQYRRPTRSNPYPYQYPSRPPAHGPRP